MVYFRAIQKDDRMNTFLSFTLGQNKQYVSEKQNRVVNISLYLIAETNIIGLVQ